MVPKKSKKKARELLNKHCSLSEVAETQRRHAAEESASLQVSPTELSALIGFIIRKEIGAAFDRLQEPLDASRVELSSSWQKLGEL